MIEAFANIGTAFGLSTASGLNAYLPMLVVALIAKYTNLVTLNEPWDVMTSWWVIGVLVILMAIEMTADKFPAVDTANDIIHTFIRPVAGAILFTASSGVIGEAHPVLMFICGLLIAGSVHAAKTTARPVVTASTVGTGNWLVSLVEDAISLAITILSVVLPILMLILVVIFFTLLLMWWLKRRKRHREVTV